MRAVTTTYNMHYNLKLLASLLLSLAAPSRALLYWSTVAVKGCNVYPMRSGNNHISYIQGAYDQVSTKFENNSGTGLKTRSDRCKLTRWNLT